MKLNVFAKIGLIVGLLGGAAGIAVGIITAPIPGTIFALVFVLIFFFVYWKIFRPMVVSNKLLKTGTPAQATVLKVWDTGVTVNNDPQVGILLEVSPPMAMPYQVETKMIISRLQPNLLQQGMVVTVKIDPDDKDKVAIDLSGGTSGVNYTDARKKEAEQMLLKIDRANQELMAYGESARAIVTKYTWMGINVNGNNPAVTLELEVLPETRKSFRASAKGVIMETSIPKFQPGEEIFVKFDSNDTSKVTIDHS
ncbi:MAG: hypothetical protein ACRDFC_07715 [Ignavibacteria bacterium]